MGESELIEMLRNLDQPVDPSDKERERIWRILVTGLESDGSTGTKPTGGVSLGPGRPATFGRVLGQVAAVAAVVLLLGFGAVWLGDREGPVTDGGTNATVDKTLAVPLPDTHPAASIVAAGADDTTTFSDRARELGLPFICGSGGMSQLCLLYADGLMAIVPLASGPGFTATLSGNGIDRAVTVPIDDGPLAVSGPGGQVQAIIRDANDEQVAAMGGGLHPRSR